MGVPAAAATRGARSATSRFRRNQACPSSPTASVPPPTASDTTGFAAAADRKALVNDACGKRAVTEAVSE